MTCNISVPKYTGKGAYTRMDNWIKRQNADKLRKILKNRSRFTSSFRDDVRNELYRRGLRVNK